MTPAPARPRCCFGLSHRHNDNPKPDCGGYEEEMGLNWGLRTATHKLVENADGSLQLFDLQTDPYELTNLASDPAQTRLKQQLRARLNELKQ